MARSHLVVMIADTMSSGSLATHSPASSSLALVPSGSRSVPLRYLSTTPGAHSQKIPTHLQGLPLASKTLDSTPVSVSRCSSCPASQADTAISGFLHLWMGFLCLIYMICALRTNLVFVGIFATLIPAFGCLAGAYWHLAQGNADTATTLLVAAGAVSFISDLLGWWIFAAIMLAALDFPFQLPGKSSRTSVDFECIC